MRGSFFLDQAHFLAESLEQLLLSIAVVTISIVLVLLDEVLWPFKELNS